MKVGKSEISIKEDIKAIRIFPTKDVDFICFNCRGSNQRCEDCLNLTKQFQKFDKFEINCTIESGESPSLDVRRTFREKINENEIELWFKGDNHSKNPYHFEKIAYSKKPPYLWDYFGYFILSPQQAYDLAMHLLKACKAPIDIHLKVEV